MEHLLGTRSRLPKCGRRSGLPTGGRSGLPKCGRRSGLPTGGSFPSTSGPPPDPSGRVGPACRYPLGARGRRRC